jgi:hypothetical protein
MSKENYHDFVEPVCSDIIKLCSSSHHLSNSNEYSRGPTRIAYEQSGLSGNKSVTDAHIDKQAQSKNQPERIMILTGTWEMPRCRYGMSALLHLKADGNADGTIDWNAKYEYGIRKSFSDAEQVIGSIASQQIDLKGFDTGPRLYADHYCIDLIGDNRSGSFKGVSETCNKDWSGTLQGTYVYLIQ